MADGRSFTDYRTRCEQYPTKAAGLWGEHDARQRMVANSQDFMDATKELLNKKLGSQGCTDTMVPELYKRVCTYKGMHSSIRALCWYRIRSHLQSFISLSSI